MDHVQIDDRGNDFWSQIGKGVGMIGGLIFASPRRPRGNENYARPT